MGERSRTAFLAEVALFAGVPALSLDRIAPQLVEQRLLADGQIFASQDPGDALYLIVAGQVRIEEDGIRLATRGPGEWFGEFAALDGGARTAAALAQTDVVLLRWDEHDFRRSLRDDPELSRAVFRCLTARLRQDVTFKLDTARLQAAMDQDLRRARQIQRAMLPKGPLSLPGLEMAGQCRPAAHVGGDYFDHFELPQGRAGLILSDVQGHGIFSALVAATAKGCLHTQAAFDAAPPAVISAMNRAISISERGGLLMSACYVLFDAGARRLEYCNAGHPHPFHYRRATDALERLESTDMILGVPGVGDLPRSAVVRPWEPGDLLLLYSDGITDAGEETGDAFGEQRLAQALRRARDGSAIEVLEAVLRAVDAHTGGSAGDDLTLVVARALP